MKCRLTEAQIDAALELLERGGVLERLPDENGERVWMYGGVKTPEAELNRMGVAATGVQLVIADKDKVVLEIRDGVVLFLNEPAHEGEADGWWWGLDEAPIMFGPFESVEAAAKAASEVSDKPIRVIEHYDVEGEIHYDGFVTINVFDTDGHIWVRTGEEPVARIPHTAH